MFKASLPDAVKHKIELLKKQAEQIANLESQLDSLRSEYAALEEELAPHRSSPHSSLQVTRVKKVTSEEGLVTRKSPIDRCPDEILLMIFEQTLGQYHFIIHRLLLVCNRWYRLLMGTATIWARVQVFNGSELFDFVDRRMKWLPYIDRCVELSQGLPLDVWADLSHIPSCSTYIQEAILHLLHRIIQVDEGPQLSALEEAICGVNLEFTSIQYEEQLEKVIDCLFGTDESRLRRWKNVTLVLPDDDSLALKIWSKFKQSLPQLVTLNISGIPDSLAKYSDSAPTSSTPLSSIKSLSILDSVSMVAHGISYVWLESISIRMHGPISYLLALNNAFRLRTLEIRGYIIMEDEGEEGGDTTKIQFCIRLPHLRRLFLGDNYRGLQHVKFDLPALDTLRIQGYGEFITPPNMSPHHIHWNPDERRCRETLEPMAKGSICDLLSLSTNVESLTVREFARTSALEAIEEARKKGSLPSFTHLLVEHDNGLFEKVVVRDVARELTLVVN